MTDRRVVVLASAFALAPVVDWAGVSAQQRLAVDASELFEIGRSTDKQFGRILAVAVSEDGRTVVSEIDGPDDKKITAFAPDGSIISKWGREGEGPGEILTAAAAAAAGVDTVWLGTDLGVAAYNWTGEEIVRHQLPGIVFALAPMPVGLVTWRLAVGPDLAFALRLQTADSAHVWADRDYDLMLADPFRSRPLLAAAGRQRFAFGMSDAYRLTVVSGSDGAVVGEISRDVERRPVSDGFAEAYRQHVTQPDAVPEDWSWIVPAWTPPVAEDEARQLQLDEFPLIDRVFWGPPGVLWVGRGLGVSDEFSAPLENPGRSRLWDLFDAGTLQWLATVDGLPADFTPMAGNANVLAGTTYDRMGSVALRVLHVSVPGLYADNGAGDLHAGIAGIIPIRQ